MFLHARPAGPAQPRNTSLGMLSISIFLQVFFVLFRRGDAADLTSDKGLELPSAFGVPPGSDREFLELKDLVYELQRRVEDLSSQLHDVREECCGEKKKKKKKKRASSTTILAAGDKQSNSTESDDEDEEEEEGYHYRRLGTMYNTATSGGRVGCYKIQNPSATSAYNLDLSVATSCGGNLCPDCFLAEDHSGAVTASPNNIELTITKCSEALISPTLSISGVREYTFINNMPTGLLTIKDGVSDAVVAPQTSLRTWCRGDDGELPATNVANRIQFPNYHFPQLKVDGASTFAGLTTHSLGLEVGGGYTGGGADLETNGNFKTDGQLAVTQTSTLAALANLKEAKIGDWSAGVPAYLTVGTNADLSSAGSLSLTDNTKTVDIQGGATVVGTLEATSQLDVGDGGYSNSGITVVGSTGVAQSKGNLKIDGELSVHQTSTFGTNTPSGVANFEGGLTVGQGFTSGGGEFTAAGAFNGDANMFVKGTFEVEGSSTLSSAGNSGGATVLISADTTVGQGCAGGYSNSAWCGGNAGTSGLTISVTSGGISTSGKVEAELGLLSGGTSTFQQGLETGNGWTNTGAGTATHGATLDQNGILKMTQDIFIDGQAEIGGGFGSGAGTTIYNDGKLDLSDRLRLGTTFQTGFTSGMMIAQDGSIETRGALTVSQTASLASHLYQEGDAFLATGYNDNTGTAKTGISITTTGDLSMRGNFLTDGTASVAQTSTFTDTITATTGMTVGTGAGGGAPIGGRRLAPFVGENPGITITPDKIEMDGDLVVHSDMEVHGNAGLLQDIVIGNGSSRISWDGNIALEGGISTQGDAKLGGSVTVTSQMNIGSDLTIGPGNDGTANGGTGVKLTYTGQINAFSNMFVGGTTTMVGKQIVEGGIEVGGDHTLVNGERGMTIDSLGNLLIMKDLIVKGGIEIAESGNFTRQVNFDDGFTVGSGLGMMDSLGNVITQGAINAEKLISGRSGLHISGDKAILDTQLTHIGANTGYAGTGVTITNAGALSMKTDLEVGGTTSVTGQSTLSSVVKATQGITFGTGYGGSTGATISANGDIQSAGALVVDETLHVKQTSTFAQTITLEGGLDVYNTGTSQTVASISTNGDGVLGGPSGTLSVTGASTLLDNVKFSTGYDGTGGSNKGCDFFASTGTLYCDGQLKVDSTAVIKGASTLLSDVRFSTGYDGTGGGSKGCQFTAASGNLQCDGSLSVDQATQLKGTVKIGDGWDGVNTGTGATFDVANSGTVSMAVFGASIINGALEGKATSTFAQTVTMDNDLQIGTGYTNTGCSIAANGEFQTKGNIKGDGTLYIGGASSLKDTVKVGYNNGGSQYGYQGGGIDLTNTGIVSMGGNLRVDGAATIVQSGDFATANSAVVKFGDGWDGNTGTGVTISSAGTVFGKSNAQFGGTLVVAQQSTLTGDIVSGGSVTIGPVLRGCQNTACGATGDPKWAFTAAGDLANDGTLSVEQTASILGDVSIGSPSPQATVIFTANTGAVSLDGAACIGLAAANTDAILNVGGQAVLKGDVSVGVNGYQNTGTGISLSASTGDFSMNGALKVGQTSTFDALGRFDGGLSVYNAGTAQTMASISSNTGNGVLEGTLSVTSASTLKSDVKFGFGYDNSGSGNLGCTVTANTGSLECDGTLLTDGSATVKGDLQLDGSVTVSTNAVIDGTLSTKDDVDLSTGYVGTGCKLTKTTGALQCKGATTLVGSLLVKSASTYEQDVDFQNFIKIRDSGVLKAEITNQGAMTMAQDLTVAGALKVDSTSTLSQTVMIGLQGFQGGGNTGMTFDPTGGLSMDGQLSVDGTGVTHDIIGTTTLSGNVVIGAATGAYASSTLKVGGGYDNSGSNSGLTVSQDGSVETNQKIVGGTLSIAGASTLQGQVDISVDAGGTVYGYTGGTAEGITLGGTDKGSISMHGALVVKQSANIGGSASLVSGGSAGTIEIGDSGNGAGGAGQGMTITDAGVIVTDGAVTLSSTVSVGAGSTFAGVSQHTLGLKTGTGWSNAGATGADLTGGGALSIDGNLLVDGTSSVKGVATFVDDVKIGSQSQGYGGSNAGVTIDASNGHLSMGGNLKVDGTATITDAAFDGPVTVGGGGNGYAGTNGATITADGKISLDSNLVVDGTLSVTQTASLVDSVTLASDTAAGRQVVIGAGYVASQATGTGCTLGWSAGSGAHHLECKGKVITGMNLDAQSTTVASTIANDLSVGGGYTGTGVSILANGKVSMKSNLQVAGTALVAQTTTLSDVTNIHESLHIDDGTGVGFAGTGFTLTNQGALSMKGALSTIGATTLTTADVTQVLTVGGGYQGAGITFTGNTGHIATDGSLTVGTSLLVEQQTVLGTANTGTREVVFGNGYANGGTGATIVCNTGVVSARGNIVGAATLYVAQTSTLGGLEVLGGTFTVDSSGNINTDGTASIKGASTLNADIHFYNNAGTASVAKMSASGGFDDLDYVKIATGSSTDSQFKTLKVTSDATLAGDATIGDTGKTISVTGSSMTANGDLEVTGAVSVGSGFTNGGITMTSGGALEMADNLQTHGTASIAKTLLVTQTSTLTQTADIAGAATISSSGIDHTGTLNIEGAATLGSNNGAVTRIGHAATSVTTAVLNIGGIYQGAGNPGLTVYGDGKIESDGALAVGGSSTLGQGFTINTGYQGGNTGGATFTYSNSAWQFKTDGTFVADGASTLGGDVTIGTGAAGTGTTLTADGKISCDNELKVNSDATINGALTIGGDTQFGPTGYTGTSAPGPAGASMTAAGVLKMDGDLVVVGSSTISGTDANSGLGLKVDGPASMVSGFKIGSGPTAEMTSAGALSAANMYVTGNGVLSTGGTLEVSQTSSLSSDLKVNGELVVVQASTLTGNTKVSGTLSVVQATTLVADTAVTNGQFSVAQTSTLYGNTQVTGTLTAQGATFAGTEVTTLKATSTSTLMGNVLVGSDGQGVAGTNGGSTIYAQTPNTGGISMTGKLHTQGVLSVDGNCDLGSSGANSGTVNIFGGGGNTGVTITAAGSICADGAATVGQSLKVGGTSTFDNDITVGDGWDSGGTATGISITAGNTGTGGISMEGNLIVVGGSTLTQTASLAGNLQVSGASTFSQTVSLNAANLVVGGTLSVAQTSSFADDLDVGGGYGSTQGASIIANTGSLQLDGAATITQTLKQVTGFSTLNSARIGNSGNGYQANTGLGVTVTDQGAISANGRVLAGAELWVESTSYFVSQVLIGNQKNNGVSLTPFSPTGVGYSNCYSSGTACSTGSGDFGGVTISESGQISADGQIKLDNSVSMGKNANAKTTFKSDVESLPSGSGGPTFNWQTTGSSGSCTFGC